MMPFAPKSLNDILVEVINEQDYTIWRKNVEILELKLQAEGAKDSTQNLSKFKDQDIEFWKQENKELRASLIKQEAQISYLKQEIFNLRKPKQFVILGNDMLESDLAIAIKPDEIENFKLLINKGLNTWSKAPASIKEFGDKITNNGQVWQDYSKQE